jgi:hypothetical protein
MYCAVFPSFTQPTRGLKHASPNPTDRPCSLQHTQLNRYETCLFIDNKLPNENLNLYINRNLNGRIVNTELHWNVTQIWFLGLQLSSTYNSLQFRDCTYRVTFVHLPRQLYYTKRIMNTKKWFISLQLSFEIPAFCAPTCIWRVTLQAPAQTREEYKLIIMGSK